MLIDEVDIFHMEEQVWLATKPVGVSAYDFRFEPLFQCRRPYLLPEGQSLICRFGPFEDYEASYSAMQELGFNLINSVEEHLRASQLENWYPLITDLTPASKWYEAVPDISEIEEDFTYPIFIKGSRQTAKHKESLCVARNRQECIDILQAYQSDPILHWQKLVCREFIELEKVASNQSEKVSTSFEFRSFWYKRELVGVGHYWSEFVQYDWSDQQRSEALLVAGKACERVNVPFLVIDLALTKEGKWIVIECNDGQESGYAGVNPILLWKNIIEIEKAT